MQTTKRIVKDVVCVINAMMQFLIKFIAIYLWHNREYINVFRLVGKLSGTRYYIVYAYYLKGAQLTCYNDYIDVPILYNKYAHYFVSVYTHS